MLRHRLFQLLLLLSALVLFGCASKLNELHVASGFDWSRLSTGNAIVLGFRTTTAGVNESLLPALRADLAGSWKAERKGLRLSTFDEAKAEEDVRHEVETALTQYATTRNVSQELTHSLGTRFSAKHIVVGYVSKYSEDESTRTEGSGDDEKKYQVRTSALSARVAIFDADSGQLMWEAEHTESASNESAEHDSVIGSLVEGAFDAAAGTGGYPGPRKTARTLFERMGKFLPES